MSTFWFEFTFAFATRLSPDLIAPIYRVLILFSLTAVINAKLRGLGRLLEYLVKRMAGSHV